jgi:hypothetical protein
MDENEYRRLCSQPDVMRRSDVRATISRLQHRNPDLAARLARLLSSPPVPKPIEHSGGADTEFLWLDLAEADIDEIVTELVDFEASLTVDEAPTQQLSEASALLDLWNEAESSRSEKRDDA